jgi:hypothetical protein
VLLHAVADVVEDATDPVLRWGPAYIGSLLPGLLLLSRGEVVGGRGASCRGGGGVAIRKRPYKFRASGNDPGSNLTELQCVLLSGYIPTYQYDMILLQM